MLVVTVEVWPGGNPARLKAIETLYVWNTSSGLADVADYEYQFDSDPRFDCRPAGKILGHEVDAGAWELVRRIMLQEFGGE